MKNLKSTLIYTLLFVLFLVGNVYAVEHVPLNPDPSYKNIAKRVAKTLPARHLLREPMDDKMSQRAWTNYLSSLDYTRVYFTQKDIALFRTEEKLLDNMLQSGDISFAYDVFNLFMERLENRCQYVEKVLATGFDLDKKESLILRDNDSPWPLDEKEQNELWRKKIKNEYLRQVLADEQAKTAMTNLVAAIITNSVDTVITNIINTIEGATNVVTTSNKVFEARLGNYTNIVTDDKLFVAVTNILTYTNLFSDINSLSVTNTATEAVNKIVVEKLTPEEKIIKRYRQMQEILNDSEADWVLQKYLTAFAHAYDPHTDYMSHNMSEDFDIDMSLSLVGIGAMLRSEDGAAKVVRLIPGGPAASDKSANKLQPGDKIIGVAQGDEDAVDIRHRPLGKIVRYIRGKKGTKVVLTVIPVNDPTGVSTKQVTLIRDEVKLDQQAASSKVRKVMGADGIMHKIGIIDLPTFYATLRVRSPSDPEFRSSSYDVGQEIKKLQDEKVDGIILDLRSNGGGSLLEAIKMVGQFIRTGSTVMVQEWGALHVLPDNDPTVAYSGPLMVLVNRLSASASEIVAAALQDYNRAIIMGDSKTHGKGTVQTVLPLGFDRKLGKIKVTTAGYYRISGKSTQLCGVVPDIIMSSGYDFMELGEDTLPNPIKCIPVNKAIYKPVSNLGTVITELRQKSKERLAHDPRFAAYQKLLKRIEKINNNKSISLNIDERRKLAIADKELSELQEKLMPADDGFEDPEKPDDEEKAEHSDIVLDEAIKVMGDYMGYKESKFSITDGSSRTSWPKLIEEMLKNL